ncbi:hypothetical protein [Paraburkholderia fungorum]|uniref:hypothetical protein n=1 Tax=Paraburkholderia fungorum TaxID=134537 RepID=UPI0038BB6265
MATIAEFLFIRSSGGGAPLFVLVLRGKMCRFLHCVLLFSVLFLVLGFFGVLWNSFDFSLRGLGLKGLWFVFLFWVFVLFNIPLLNALPINFYIGLLAFPLCGGHLLFFAAAKKSRQKKAAHTANS